MDAKLKKNKMKKIFLNITFSLVLLAPLFIYSGCDSPAPTELIIDNNTTIEDPVDVEIITKDTQDEFYSNGFDSTGVAQRLHNFGNVIVLTGTKISNNNSIINTSLAQAVFFDKNMPVRNMHGDVVGFHTVLPGEVKINGITSKIRPFEIKFRNGATLIDTTLGSMYVVFSGRQNSIDPFAYRFNSSVSFQLIPSKDKDPSTSFSIPTPQKITGKVTINGRKSDKSLKAVLEWNGTSSQKIEIVLGVMVKGSNISFPLYSLKTRDDGRLVVPDQLLNSIPFEKFDKIIFSFVRRLEFDNGKGSNHLKILSQSIHTIIINI